MYEQQIYNRILKHQGNIIDKLLTLTQYGSADIPANLLCMCRWTLPWSAPSCCWRGRTMTCGSSPSSTTTRSAMTLTRPNTSLCPSPIRWSATNCWPPKISTCACSSSKSKNKEWGKRKRRRRRRKKQKRGDGKRGTGQRKGCDED